MIEIVAALVGRFPETYSWGLFQAGFLTLIGVIMGGREQARARKDWAEAAPGVSKRALNAGVSEVVKTVTRLELGLGRGAIKREKAWRGVGLFAFFFTAQVVTEAVARAVRTEGFGEFVGLVPVWAWSWQVGCYVLTLASGIALMGAPWNQLSNVMSVVRVMSFDPKVVSRFIHIAALKDAELEADVIAGVSREPATRGPRIRRL